MPPASAPPRPTPCLTGPACHAPAPRCTGGGLRGAGPDHQSRAHLKLRVSSPRRAGQAPGGRGCTARGGRGRRGRPAHAARHHQGGRAGVGRGGARRGGSSGHRARQGAGGCWAPWLALLDRSHRLGTLPPSARERLPLPTLHPRPGWPCLTSSARSACVRGPPHAVMVGPPPRRMGPAGPAGGARGGGSGVAVRRPAGGAPGRQDLGLQRAPRWRRRGGPGQAARRGGEVPAPSSRLRGMLAVLLVSQAVALSLAGGRGLPLRRLQEPRPPLCRRHVEPTASHCGPNTPPLLQRATW